MFESVSTLNDDDINETIQALRNHEQFINPVAQKVMRSLKQVGRHVFGSPLERSQNRQMSKGMLMALGMESCMVTVNFDDTR